MEFNEREWIYYWDDPEEAIKWHEAGWSSPKEAAEWHEAGWDDPKEALEWYEVGWRDPKKALEWHEEGWIDPEEALKWYEAGWGEMYSSEALEWFEAGWEDPEEALKWKRAGVDNPDDPDVQDVASAVRLIEDEGKASEDALALIVLTIKRIRGELPNQEQTRRSNFGIRR